MRRYDATAEEIVEGFLDDSYGRKREPHSAMYAMAEELRKLNHMLKRATDFFDMANKTNAEFTTMCIQNLNTKHK